MWPLSLWKNCRIKQVIQNMKRGYTLLEVMVTFVLISLIAAFGIPAFQRSINKALERDAIITLQALRGALKIYKAKNGDYPSFDMANISEINSALGTDIADTKLTYTYSANFGGLAQLTQASYSGNWRIRFYDIDSNVKIHCAGVSGSCPTCSSVVATGCKNGD